MPHKGQVIDTEEARYEFIETGADTNGERIVVKFTQRNKGPLAPDHLHAMQDEHFEILSGTLTCFEGKVSKKYTAGQKVSMLKGLPHNHYNTDDEPVEYIQTVTPAYDLDYFIENLGGLANDGKVKNGQPEFMQAMMWVNYLDGKTYLADVPIPIQKALAKVLSPIGRLMGYKAIYKKYTGIDK